MSGRMENRLLAGYEARHFRYAASADGKVATITLDRPERRNPLTFEAYAELRDLFAALALATDVKAVVVTGAGGNFCSGGDVHEIIGPLIAMAMPELLAFTRMTGDLVLAMRTCPQPIVAAVEGTCAGAGAMIALASDLRIGAPTAKTAFLFVRVVSHFDAPMSGRVIGGRGNENARMMNRKCAKSGRAQGQILCSDILGREQSTFHHQYFLYLISIEIGNHEYYNLLDHIRVLSSFCTDRFNDH